MEVRYGIRRVKKYKKPVVVLGVFDGVHRGHRSILNAAARKARHINGKSVVLTFWPHPQKEESLYSLQHRLRLIDELGIDVCVVINLNRGFAMMPAEDFVKKVLVDKIRVSYLYVGKNFRFGRRQEGDFKLLKILSKKYNFALRLFRVIRMKTRPISSTYIRRLIKKGRIDEARNLLYRPVSIYGTVIKGDSLAKELGFPTANIDPHHEVIPASGVYMVNIIMGAKKFNGICNIGSKPTIRGRRKKRTDRGLECVEVHIFNFAGNIYNRDLEIQFIKRLRDELEFPSRKLLVEQVRKDIKEARRYFSRH